MEDSDQNNSRIPPQNRPRASYPWDGQSDFAACNFALGTFLNNLRGRVTVNGRLHAETYLAASGVIAGFAAQYALLTKLVAEQDDVALGQLRSVAASTGKFFQGRPLYDALVPDSTANLNERLWSVAGRGAEAAGMDTKYLPRVLDLFTHVTTAIGSEKEGMPSVAAEHYPQLPLRQLLTLLWPFASMCLTGDAPEVVAPGKRLWPAHLGPASTRFWPAITAHAAASIIHEVKGVLDPVVALRIVMESAIYGSMLDQRPDALTGTPSVP